MICATYARKSTDDSDRNEDARSTTRQVERATEYAQARGWRVAARHVFVDEDVSGAAYTKLAGRAKAAGGGRGGRAASARRQRAEPARA